MTNCKYLENYRIYFEEIKYFKKDSSRTQLTRYNSSGKLHSMQLLNSYTYSKF